MKLRSGKYTNKPITQSKSDLKEWDNTIEAYQNHPNIITIQNYMSHIINDDCYAYEIDFEREHKDESIHTHVITKTISHADKTYIPYPIGQSGTILNIYDKHLTTFDCPRYIIHTTKQTFKREFTMILSFYFNVIERMMPIINNKFLNEKDNNVRKLFRKMTYIKFVFQLIYDNRKTIKENYDPYFYDKFVTNITKKAEDVAKDITNSMYYLSMNKYVLDEKTLKFMNNYKEFMENYRTTFQNTKPESTIINNKVVVSCKDGITTLQPLEELVKKGVDTTKFGIYKLEYEECYEDVITRLASGSLVYAGILQHVK